MPTSCITNMTSPSCSYAAIRFASSPCSQLSFHHKHPGLFSALVWQETESCDHFKATSGPCQLTAISALWASPASPVEAARAGPCSVLGYCWNTGMFSAGTCSPCAASSQWKKETGLQCTIPIASFRCLLWMAPGVSHPQTEKEKKKNLPMLNFAFVSPPL